MSKKLLSIYGLKWDPFSADVPSEALFRTPQLDCFCTRVEQLVSRGGFACITGEAGSGKSVALRVLAERLAEKPDVSVAVLSRPQSSVPDFYRELGHLFGVPLAHHGRWAPFKTLRDRWVGHFDSTMTRPVLLVDEAQQASPLVLSEIRLLSSMNFDSRSLMTTVLCGDNRLTDLFRLPELIPLASRLRARLILSHAAADELIGFLIHAQSAAGNSALMTPELMAALSTHAASNYRVLTNMASQLLDEAAARDLRQLDEKLFFELFAPTPVKRRPPRP